MLDPFRNGIGECHVIYERFHVMQFVVLTTGFGLARERERLIVIYITADKDVISADLKIERNVMAVNQQFTRGSSPALLLVYGYNIARCLLPYIVTIMHEFRVSQSVVYLNCALNDRGR